MSLNEKDRHEISELASSATDGNLSETRRKRLEEILRSSEDARAFYVRFMGISAGLAWAARNESSPMPKQTRRIWQRSWLQISAAAAVLVLAFLGGWLMVQRPTANRDGGVAILSTAINPEWVDSQEPAHVRNVLKPGWIHLKSGLAQVEFFSGTSVWLEGPASFRLDSDKQGYMDSGRLVAEVPKGSQGFRIETKFGAVVDRGTGFALNVTDVSAAVHVYDGSVDVTPSQGSTQNLVAGLAVVMDAAGGGGAGGASSTHPIPLDVRGFDYFGYGWGMDGFAMQEWPEHSPNGYFTAPGSFVEGHGHWRGLNPHDLVRNEMGVEDDKRWAVIEPKITAFLDAQHEYADPPDNMIAIAWSNWAGGAPNNDVTRSWWDLNACVRNPDVGDDELQMRLDTYHSARLVARERLNRARDEMIKLLNDKEEAQLLMLGCLK